MLAIAKAAVKKQEADAHYTRVRAEIFLKYLEYQRTIRRSERIAIMSARSQANAEMRRREIAAAQRGVYDW